MRHLISTLVVGYRKQNTIENGKYWQKKWSRSLTKFENRSLTREFLQQYLIERQNGSLERWSFMGGGRLLEVVATGELTVLVSLQHCSVIKTLLALFWNVKRLLIWKVMSNVSSVGPSTERGLSDQEHIHSKR